MTLTNTEKINYIVKLSSRAFKQYRKRLVLIFVLSILSGLSGGIGIGAIIPLFSLAISELAGEENRIAEIIRHTFEFLHLPFNLPFLVIFIVALFVIKGVINFFTKYINDKAVAEYERITRRDLVGKLFNSKWPYLMEQKLGYMERVIMNDVFVSSRILINIRILILYLTSFLMYAIIAFNISVSITIITAISGALLVLVFKPIFYKTRRVAKELADTEKLVTHHISESILGAKTIKAFATENQVIKKGDEYFNKLKKARIKTALYIYSVSAVFEPMAFIFVAVVFFFYFKSPNFNIVAFGAIAYLIQKMFAFVQSTQSSIHRINEAVPFLQTVLSFRSSALADKEESMGALSFEFKREIRFRDINFAYNDRMPVLNNVTFAIEKGEMVGLIGASGAGKTTIADMLLRLFQPRSGEILMDDKNISEFNVRNWRKKIGYVSQDVFLLNDSINNNIKFYDDSITENDIIKAAKAAHIYDFIEKLPQGFETNMGERGLKLSGGQKQRIALARVIARQPEILILDEATSSLDTKSELAIQKAIENLKGKITVLAIAHRLSTVIKSDKLLVMDEGKIIEEGPPDSLLKNKDSHFYKMYNIRQN